MRDSSAPLGVKITAVWAVIAGIALLVLGVTQTPLYVPLGIALLLGAYGLWTLQTWGLVLAGLAFALEGVQDILEGAVVELVIVLLVLLYLYTQRHHFDRVLTPQM
jgi:hypothetical protein